MAFGNAQLTTMLFFIESWPQALLTKSLTVYVPGSLYTCEGLVADDVWLSPKSQKDKAALDDVFVKFNVNPLTLEVYEAVGFAQATVISWQIESIPQPLLTFKQT